MTRLSVNVNKVALLRNARPLNVPDVAHMAALAIRGGAHGITVHPRPDERHIRRSDVLTLRALTRDTGVELNIEGNPFHGILDLALAVRPEQCTLVPDPPDAVTSDHGWDLDREAERLASMIATLRAAAIRVSLFLDPNAQSMVRARDLGADRVELYTEPYARAFDDGRAPDSLRQYAAAARSAQRVGLGLNAGHDLNLANLGLFVKNVPGVLEVSIGHALVADALESGMEATVRRYLSILSTGSE